VDRATATGEMAWAGGWKFTSTLGPITDTQ